MNGTAEVFRRAAAIMAERGQCKGDAEGPNGEVCLIAALTFAAGEIDRALYRVADRILDEVYANVAEDARGVIQWQDAPDTTQTEVEKFLLHCADVAEFDTARA